MLTCVPSRTVSRVRPLISAELESIVRRLSRETHAARALDRDSSARDGVRIHSTRDFDAWLLRWPPGTRVNPHDHGDSAGAFTVLEGELIELRWHASIPECRLVAAGDVVSIASGVVHDVVATNRVACSIHAYSPPLQTMSFYEVASPAPRGQGGWSSDLASPVPVRAESVMLAFDE
jgi:quercetin dioxygenase-like cupin family protein